MILVATGGSEDKSRHRCKGESLILSIRSALKWRLLVIACRNGITRTSEAIPTKVSYTGKVQNTVMD